MRETAALQEFVDTAEGIQFEILEDNRQQNRMTVRGIFQRANTKNANGRIYSSSLWERVLNDEKTKSSLKSRTMLGTVEHPCFTSSDFRILTTQGWKHFRDLRKGDYAWSRKDGVAVKSLITAIVDQPYSGPVYKVEGRSINSEFSPGHRFLFTSRTDRKGPVTQFYATISDIAKNRKAYTHFPIPKTAVWEDKNSSTFTIPGTKYAGYTQDLVLDAKVFCGLIGIYLAEGHCTDGNNYHRLVYISQKNEWSTNYIESELFAKLPPEVNWRRVPNGFYITDSRLWEYLVAMGNAYSKYIPAEVKELGPDNLRELIHWFVVGDGKLYQSSVDDVTPVKNIQPELKRWYTDPRETIETPSFKSEAAVAVREKDLPYIRQELHSVSECLIRDLHECVLRTGRSGTVKAIQPKEDYMFAGRIIKAENKVPLWQLSISNTKAIYLAEHAVNITERQHTGNIYCITTTEGNFCVEQNGKQFWTGNSSGVTALSAVSHVITSLKPQGDVIVGEAEVLNTPMGQIIKELIRAKVKVGISSRGRGTSSVRGGVEYVDESTYQLDTFDFVYRPSTPGAYVDLIGESLKGPYQKDSKMSEKLDELKRLEVKALDIIKHAASSDASTLTALFRESVEIQAAAETLASQLASSDDTKSSKDVVEGILAKVAEARTTVSSRLDTVQETVTRDTDRKIDNALDDIVPETVGKDKPTSRTESQIEYFKKLLKETREQRDYYKARFDEKKKLVEASSDEIRTRYDAAVKLGENLLAKVSELENDLVEVSQGYQQLEMRLEAAKALVVGIAERQEQGKLIRKVREAIELHPELESFKDLLLSCKTDEELEKRVSECIDALGLPSQDKTEALLNQVVVSAEQADVEENDVDTDSQDEVEQEEEESEGDLGESSDLPEKGVVLNESAVAGSVPTRMLNENSPVVGAALAARVINNKRGWQ